ncbi:hypothetical protein JQ621_03100 [Bradyrhizobium manausense]|uniref:hypothetical protein n=1 Tax=Bradyrhizobium manausense TaxID=989370 RepID=UPI001BAB8552|nr:hypothetical protein [Bradyrhizobium manausense]MBR1086455.1 hypothetical protein [Bradyrhizobium manausense]
MSEKPKPISKKIRAAIEALVEGENITAAAATAGLSRSHLSRELGRPHIAALLRQKVERNLAINAAKAGVTKVNLLDSSNEMVRDRASSFILSLAGIKPDVDPGSRQTAQLPGLQIVIVQPPGITGQPRVIGPEPVRQIENEPNHVGSK